MWSLYSFPMYALGIFRIYLFPYFCLFLAALSLCYVWGFSGCSEQGGGGRLLFLALQAAHHGSPSGGRARTPGCTDFSSCGFQASLLHGMRDLPRPGIEPASPALTCRFLTSGPQGTSCSCFLNVLVFNVWLSKGERGKDEEVVGGCIFLKLSECL